MSDNKLAEKVLNENVLIHALENKDYLRRHPEQTNYYQYARLTKNINRVIDLLPDNSCKVFDIGCGTGYLYLEFLRKGFEVTGIDISPEMLEVVEEKISFDLKSKAKLINGDAYDYLKSQNEVFSLITMSAFLHHLFDYEILLKAVTSSLKRGGILLIVFEPLKQPIKSGIQYFFHKLLKVVDEIIYRTSMLLQKIDIPNEKYIYSDFQRRFGGIDINNICRILKSGNLTILFKEKYCARRYGIPSFIATKIINSENSFDIIAVKQ